MTASDFSFFQDKLRALSGMTLWCFTPGIRRRFFQGCLRPRLNELRLSGFSEYRAYLSRLPKHHVEWSRFVDVFRVGRTRFFREPSQLKELMSTLAASPLSRKRKLRVWCCACSSGEEAFTLAVLMEGLACHYEIVGTDLNSQVIDVARFGLYPLRSVRRGVPREYRGHFGLPSMGRGEGRRSTFIELDPKIRARVRFERADLLRGPRPRGRFDVIVCRNVLYYYDGRTIARVAERLARSAVSGALLLVSPRDRSAVELTSWKRVGRSVFVRSTAPGRGQKSINRA